MRHYFIPTGWLHTERKFLGNLECKNTADNLQMNVFIISSPPSLLSSLSFHTHLTPEQSLAWTHSEVGWRRHRRSGGGNTGKQREITVSFSSLQLSRTEGNTVRGADSPLLFVPVLIHLLHPKKLCHLPLSSEWATAAAVVLTWTWTWKPLSCCVLGH